MKKIILSILSVSIIMGVALFHVKYQVIGLEKELVTTYDALAENQEAIHIAKAEWVYLNEPKRLEKIVLAHLNLNITQPIQVASFDALPYRGGVAVAVNSRGAVSR